MSYLRCEYASEQLKMNTSLILLLPDKAELSRVPVIYLLHGLTDNCTGWTRFSSVERYAREHGAAVVMPEVQRSFYTDMYQGVSYFSYVRDEVPEFCRRTFGLSDRREQNFIMGLSMGGYGALKCALTVPERYAGCAAFSAVTDLPGRIRRAPRCEQMEFAAIFEDPFAIPPECDLFQLAQQADPQNLPKLLLTCGEQDSLYPDNQRFASLLAERGIRAPFRHWEGDHCWVFWDRSLAMAMDAFLSGGQ